MIVRRYGLGATRKELHEMVVSRLSNERDWLLCDPEDFVRNSMPDFWPKF